MQPFAPGLGETQRSLLLELKRSGPATVRVLRETLGLAPATLREHLQSLVGMGLVERHQLHRPGRGRPEVAYQVSAGGEQLFPRAEATVLRELVAHLLGRGESGTLDEFFQTRVAIRMPEALRRVAGLTGRSRVEEVARILAEIGFMAQVVERDEKVFLKLCHCPLRELVAVTDLPCRAEVAFISRLMGRPLNRDEYLPGGAAACTYATGESAA